jgi:twitching motility protein PilT
MVDARFCQVQVNPQIDVTFSNALRTILRQDPDIIMVGEIRDSDTANMAVQAALTGHLVFSTLHTIDASKTVDRIIGTFEAGDQQAVRTRLSNTFRYIVSQRLVPTKISGRVAVLEILKSTMRTRDYLERGENEGKSLLDAMRDGELDGMQHFDGELEKLLRAGTISRATALLYATNQGNLQLQIVDIPPDA